MSAHMRTSLTSFRSLGQLFSQGLIRNYQWRRKKPAPEKRAFFWLPEWSGAGSNRRHMDFQSIALPTELPDHPTQWFGSLFPPSLVPVWPVGKECTWLRLELSIGVLTMLFGVFKKSVGCTKVAGVLSSRPMTRQRMGGLGWRWLSICQRSLYWWQWSRVYRWVGLGPVLSMRNNWGLLDRIVRV